MPFDCCGTRVHGTHFISQEFLPVAFSKKLDRCDEVDQLSDVDHPDICEVSKLFFNVQIYNISPQIQLLLHLSDP